MTCPRFGIVRLAMGLLVTGCDGEIGPSQPPPTPAMPPPPVLQSIDIQPPEATLYVNATEQGSQDYRAVGHYSDGSTADVTSTVGWTLELPLGSFPQGAHLVAATARGGQTRVHATSGSVDASATLTVVVRDRRVVPGAPADAAGRFAGAADPTLAPTLVY